MNMDNMFSRKNYIYKCLFICVIAFSCSLHASISCTQLLNTQDSWNVFVSDSNKLELWNKVSSNTKIATLEKFLSALNSPEIDHSDLVFAIEHPVTKLKLPDFESESDYVLFIKLLKGEVTPRIKAFAHYYWKGFLLKDFKLSQVLRTASKAEVTTENYVSTDESNSVSFMWYPKYPDGIASFTHTKIQVDGQVWGTMTKFSRYKSSETHERLARRSLRNGYFEFVMKVSNQELENINFLLEKNGSKGRGVLMDESCVAGACGALGVSGIINVPFPFNQVPSLAAFYLTVRRALPGGVVEIKYHGKGPLKSLASFDILLDGLPTGVMTLGAYAAYAKLFM